MPVKVQEALRAKGWRFYTFIGEGGVRLMCSWCTTMSRIEEFISDTREAVMNEVISAACPDDEFVAPTCSEAWGYPHWTTLG